MEIHIHLTFPGNTFSFYISQDAFSFFISWEYILSDWSETHALHLLILYLTPRTFLIYFRTYSWPRLVEWAFVEQTSANCFYVWSVIWENIWVFRFRINFGENPHYRVKIQNSYRRMVGPIKTCARSLWGKNYLCMACMFVVNTNKKLCQII